MFTWRIFSCWTWSSIVSCLLGGCYFGQKSKRVNHVKERATKWTSRTTSFIRTTKPGIYLVYYCCCCCWLNKSPGPTAVFYTEWRLKLYLSLFWPEHTISIAVIIGECSVLRFVGCSQCLYKQHKKNNNFVALRR